MAKSLFLYTILTVLNQELGMGMAKGLGIDVKAVMNALKQQHEPVA